MDVITHCKFDELVDPKTLKDHPKNRNKHGQDQIERLSQLYKFHGIRHPIIVSKLSGCIVAGHGRKLAALRAGVKQMPVVYQQFDSVEAEYAFIQSDNAIALWADLDLSGINDDLKDLGPDFDLNMLGIKDFDLDFQPGEIEMPELSDADKSELEQITFTLHKFQAETVRLALEKSTDLGEFGDTLNENKNGNALARVCELYLNGK